jgi:lysophospholipase L1-like esterase
VAGSENQSRKAGGGESPRDGAPGGEAAFGELASTEAAEVRLTQHTERLVADWFPISSRTLTLAIGLGALVLGPYAHPSLERFRVLTPGISVFGSDDLDPATAIPAPVEVVGEAALPGPTDDQQSRGDELTDKVEDRRGPIAKNAPLPIPVALSEDKPPHFIDEPRALEKFFAKLVKVEQKQEGAIARVVYYGDSIVASDFITGKLRRLLQDRFGDSGHGYAIVANAFPGWFHIDVSRKSSDQWKTSRCIGPFAEDGFYGLGCVSFIARREGEWFSMGTADRDKWGTNVSRFELEYLEQPDGGSVNFILDGEQHSELSTSGPDKALKYHTISVPDGPHKLEVRTASDAPTRLFGMRMERDTPGVTLSALGLTGARARFLDKSDDAHWAAALKAAKPDLVVLAFGTNEVGDGNIAYDENGQRSKDPMGDYERSLQKVMEQVEAAVPEASFMLVGPPDMASKKDDEGHSKPMVPTITKHQMNCARARGWAYWNQFKAMGGSGSMWSWVQSGLGSADLIHPTGSGGNILGKMEYLALMHAYEAYKKSLRKTR